MDGLLAEINAKRKELDRDAGPSGSDGPPRKYLRRGELEAMQEEEERRKKAEAEEKRERLKAESRAIKMRKEAEQARKDAMSRMAASPAGTPPPSGAEAFNISPEECIRRLRSKGHPIRLFGETDKDRKLRLRALELLEARDGGQNEFKKTLEGMESSMEEKKLTEMAKMLHAKAVAEKEKAEAAEAAQAEAAAAQAGAEPPSAPDAPDAGGNNKEERVDTGVLDLKLVREDPKKLYPLIYFALKNVLKKWEESMDARPEDVKRSGQGKMAAATQVSSAQNLKPLFRQLRSRDMPPDVLRNMAEIVHYMQTRQYQKANDAYLRLSIGTAAWPIGVTSVGIHERSSQDKLYADKIAHVLNDEVSRKWIQAVKRLLTFSQNVRPPKDRSMMMG